MPGYECLAESILKGDEHHPCVCGATFGHIGRHYCSCGFHWLPSHLAVQAFEGPCLSRLRLDDGNEPYCSNCDREHRIDVSCSDLAKYRTDA